MTDYRLITDPNDKQTLGTARETSALRAPLRALAGYVQDMRFAIDGQKHMEFVQVLERRAESEELAEYPAACVFSESAVQYEMENGVLVPYGTSNDRLPAGTALVSCGELRQEVSIHCWAFEDMIRENFLMGMEDAMQPVEWMAGFVLEMPHYYNLRANYLMTTMMYEDGQQDSARWYRKLMVKLKVSSMWVRQFQIPEIRPRAVQVQVDVRYGSV